MLPQTKKEIKCFCKVELNFRNFYLLPIGLTRVLSNSTASSASSFSFWFGLYGGRLIRSNMFKVEVPGGGELVVVFAARGDPETNEGHLEKRL